jgi:hypothetical protein
MDADDVIYELPFPAEITGVITSGAAPVYAFKEMERDPTTNEWVDTDPGRWGDGVGNPLSEVNDRDDVAAGSIVLAWFMGMVGGEPTYMFDAGQAATGGGVAVRKNSTGVGFTRPRINLIEGTNVTLTVADDTTDDEVDVTVAASGGATFSGCSCPVTGSQSIASSTTADVALGTESYDTAAYFPGTGGSTSRMLITVAGKYAISGWVELESTSTSGQCFLYLVVDAATVVTDLRQLINVSGTGTVTLHVNLTGYLTDNSAEVYLSVLNLAGSSVSVVDGRLSLTKLG